MKIKLLISFLSILFAFSIQAQIGIGTETPNASSLLELSSTSKGLLVPRMTEAQKNAISNPPVGLLVYQTNGQAFYYKDHFWWKILASNDNKSFMVGSIKGGIPNFGAQNLLFGFGNFAYATSGDNNTAIGFMAISSSDGSSNTAVGSNALRQGQTNTDGSYNTAVGSRALSNGDDGGYNTAIGASSIEKVEGDNNSGLGYRTLFNTSSGDANTAVGYNAGDTNSSGSNNTLIGSNSDVGSNNLINATAIGYNAIVDMSNKIRLGDTNVSVIEGPVAFSNASDRRLKENIKNTKYGLNDVLKLLPVDYNLISNGLSQIGFIAQDLKLLIPEAVNGIEGDLEKGETLGISYTSLIPVLTKAIQEQQKIINDLIKRIETLEKGE